LEKLTVHDVVHASSHMNEHCSMKSSVYLIAAIGALMFGAVSVASWLISQSKGISFWIPFSIIIGAGFFGLFVNAIIIADEENEDRPFYSMRRVIWLPCLVVLTSVLLLLWIAIRTGII